MTDEMQKIPEGYKQTEIGVIPKDWNIESIEQLATITTGSKNTQDRISEGLYPFFVRSQTVEKINSYSYDGEAVLTAGDGVGTGKVFHYINGKFDFHQRVYKISDFNKKLNGYYFFLYFSNNFFNRIMQMTAKSSVDSVRMEMIADMKILVPANAEQSAIAAALSDIDVLIEKLKKLIEKKKNIKQGAMQELLAGKRRLTGFSAKWDMKKMIDIAPLQRGFDLPSSQLKNGSCPVVYSNGILNFHHKAMAKAPGVVTGRSGTIGKVNFIEENFWPHNTTLWVTDFKGNDEKYIYFLYSHLKIERFSTGSGVPTLNRNDVYDFQVVIPKDKAEQSAIASILSDMDTEIEKLESQLAKYQNIKQGMMQTLLTGKIRLI